MKLSPFRMEQWQSTYEHRVRFNLSESGVHPLSLNELLELTGLEGLGDVQLGYGQSNGSDQLRARIAALYDGVDPDQVVVTVGGAEANMAACWHLMEPGAPVAVMVPNYMQVPGLVENLGGVVHPFGLVEERGWQPDLDELRTVLDDGARFILITNPNNPTGACLTSESRRGIVEAASSVGAWILSDEVYQGAELSGMTTPSMWGEYDRVLVTNSLSKAYGVPGLRLGWVVAPTGETETLWARTDYTTIAPASLSDQLATAALEPTARKRILQRTRDILRRNLPILSEWMDAQDGLFSYRPPEAGAICYARYDAPVNSSELAEKLRAEKSVLVVPGDHFGMDRYLRLGFGPPEAELRDALGRIGDAFKEVMALSA